jgi:hypothetical protein
VLADAYLDRHQRHPDVRRLVFWKGGWWQWDGKSYRERSEEDLKAELQRFLEEQADEVNVGRRQAWLREEGGIKPGKTRRGPGPDQLSPHGGCSGMTVSGAGRGHNRKPPFPYRRCLSHYLLREGGEVAAQSHEGP